jgi:hypothetical protein
MFIKSARDLQQVRFPVFGETVLPFVAVALESATSLGFVDPHQVAGPGAAAFQGMFICMEGRAS